MPLTRSTNMIRVMCLTVFFFASFLVVTAQTRGTADTASNDEKPTLQALLDEVRLLRLEVQRSNLQTYRTQLILGQLRIQQEHVDRVSRQLDLSRNELADAKQARVQLSERIKDAEEKMNSDPDEDTRAQARLVLKDLQVELQQKREQEQAKVERESQLAAQLQAEQSKLAVLSERMEALEREVLSTDQPEAGQPPKRKR